MIQRIRRVVAAPFVALYSGASTARDIILIAMAIAESETNLQDRQLLDNHAVRLLLGFRRRPRQVDPNRAAVLQRQAEQAKSAGDLKRAIRLYGHAIRDIPYNAALYFLRGSALLEANRPKDAAKDFVTGLQLDPGNQTLTFLMHTANAKAAEQAVSVRLGQRRNPKFARSLPVPPRESSDRAVQAPSSL
jgi:tetratricopeptide (TPR) repeat protein